MDVEYAPLRDPSGFTGGPYESSQFRVTFSQAMEVLEKELRLLEVDDVVIEIDISPSQFTLAGRPRADARASSNRVRLRAKSKHGTLTFAVDRFVRGASSVWVDVPDGEGGKVRSQRRTMSEDWQHNLYAIALGLHDLRRLERYGLGDLGQQYGGWLEIEATAGGMGPAGAWELIASFAGMSVPDAQTVPERALKRAIKAAHPDTNDGNDGYWQQLTAARKVLDL